MQPQYQQPGPSAPGATMAMQYPVIVVQGTPHSKGCVTKTFKVTGILHIVGACLCILLGIAAICLQAFRSYFAVPLWGSILIFIPTGIIGLVYNCKPKNKCIVVTYLVLSVVSASCAAIMCTMYGFFTLYDQIFDYDCYPLDYNYRYCNTPMEARIAVNILLAVVNFLELACGVTAVFVSCFKLFKCWRKCCQGCYSDDPLQSGVMYYAASGGAAPGIPMQAYSPARPIDVAGGGSSVPAAQSAGMMYLSSGPQTQQGFVAVQPTAQPPSAGPQPQQGYVAVQPTGVPPSAMQQSGSSPNVQAGPVPVTGQDPNVQAQGSYTQQPQAEVEKHVMPQEPQAPQKDEPQQEEEAAGQVTSGQFNDQAAII